MVSLIGPGSSGRDSNARSRRRPLDRARPSGMQRLTLGCIIQVVRLKPQLAWLVGLLCASASVLFPQPRPAQADRGRDNDVRTIYSWLLTHSAEQDKLYLIAPETYPTEYPDKHCLEVPLGYTADFKEIREDFDRRKNAPHQVPRLLSSPKPYVVLDPNVVKQLMKSAALSDSPIIRERYTGAEHLLLFSDISFNQKRTVALVHLDSWCGGLCGSTFWIVFEKGNNGVWQKRPWARCFGVA